MPFMMEDYYGSQLNQLKIEEAKQKLADMATAREDAAQAKADWKKAFQLETPTAVAPGEMPAPTIPDMAQGILPGESGGMPTAPTGFTAPSGDKAPSMLGGVGAEEAGKVVPTAVETTKKSPYQEFTSAAQAMQKDNAEETRLQNQIKIAQRLKMNPDNYKAGETMEKDAYNALDKLSIMKERNAKTVKEGLERTAGILNTVTDEGSLQLAKLSLQAQGHPIPSVIPGPDGRPVRTDVYSPELGVALQKQAEQALTVKDQMDLKDKAAKFAEEKRKAQVAEADKAADNLRADAKDAREREKLPYEIEALKAKAKKDAEGGSRAQQQMDRIVLSGEQAVKDLGNLSRINSTGVSTAGFKSGQTGLLAATKDALVNKISKSDYQIYDVAFSGLQRNLAVIEAVGAATGLVGLSGQMSKLAIQPNDKVETTFMKLAQARQIVETGLDFALDKENVSPVQKDKIRTYKAQLEKSIPFLPGDILDLKNAPKGSSLQDLMAAKGMKVSTTPAKPKPASTPSTRAVFTDEMLNQLDQIQG